MKARDIIVLKAGSSVLPDDAALPAVVNEIYRHVRAGRRVVAVVSALGDTTDRLLHRSERLGADARSRAALLATGEARTGALLLAALERAGIPAHLLDPAQAGLRTSGPLLDAEPVALDESALLDALQDVPVAVLPGFVGLAPDGGPSLLGRGGSDLTALFLAHALDAECVLLKDVDGIFERDPGQAPAPPRRYRRLALEDAPAIVGGVVQPKALRFAAQRGREFRVCAPGSAGGTRVSKGPTALGGIHDRAPLPIVLLGHGTVGSGVRKALSSWPAHFQLAGVAARRPKRHQATLGSELLHDDPLELARRAPCDVVVELLGGLEPAHACVRAALERGLSVVSANKELLARHGAELERLAAASSAKLRWSPAVGGAVPMLETTSRLAGRGALRLIEGILNGCSNFVLDRVSEGDSLEAAVAAAREAGLAEADTDLDLDGRDAASKLVLLARAAWRTWCDVDAVPRQVIDAQQARRARAIREQGRSLRQVARARHLDGTLSLEVVLEERPHDDDLGRVSGAGSLLRVENAGGGASTVHGKGAGRWPTTEAVLGDLLELWRERVATDVEEDASCTR